MIGVILQPSYIPWRGYFDLINRADVFVFYDDVQYDKHGWRHRNRIKTPDGVKWLSIPVASKGVVSRGQPIHDTRICWQQAWSRKHLAALTHSYSRAPFFTQYESLLNEIYSRHDEHLADFTIAATVATSKCLGIHGKQFVRASELGIAGGKTERIVNILQALGVDTYLSGPSAKAYIDQSCFDRAGIRVEYAEYRYPEYPQLHPPFDPQVSILDLLFMTGPRAGEHIWKT